ncbi:efflux transporter outer membrane subunit [Variovorax sp. RHLX14]|uniref:efflux transporter outer membrane subunit n=1 Tax=Variovorax sp. RHLX14 TaxID=1259731 RepID=UPI003F47541A
MRQQTLPETDARRKSADLLGRLGMAGFVGLFAMFGICGCTVGPDYVRPESPLPMALTREPLPTAGSAAVTVTYDWWRQFGVPELDALVAQALAQSPTVAAAEATLRAARENTIAQRGFFYPTVQAGYNASRQNVGQSVSSPLASGDSIYSYHTAQLSVGFAPDVFGGNRRQVEGLQAAEDGQRDQLAAARVTLASNIVAAAIQDATLTEQAEAVQQAIEATREQLDYARRLQANGYLSGLDVALQENQLTQLQQSLPPLEKQREQTRDLISALAGRTPDAVLPRIRLADVRMPALPSAVASELIDQRPDVHAAEMQLRAANAAIGVAKAARLPQLSITAAFSGGAIRFADMFAAGNPAWSLGAGVLQPIFSGGTLSARQRAAEAQFDAIAAQYRGTVLAAFQNVADALYAIDVDTRALRVAEAGEAATRKNFELTRLQLAQGYTTRPSALATQAAFLQNRSARIAARGALLGDTVALYQSLGGGAGTRP